jgi:hypothetical protein
MRENTELLALVGAWAKATHPEKYRATLQQVSEPRKFRAYLLRLVELRVAAEPQWIREVPLSILDETRVTRTLRHKHTGVEYVVGGVRATMDGAYTLRWFMLDSPIDDFNLVSAAMAALDLVLVPQEAPTS